MFKRNVKRILGVLLAAVVMCSCVTFALAEYVDYEEHTVTGTDGKSYTYFTNGSQYVRSGGSGNEYLNVWADNAFYFMLTEPKQKFTFEQSLRLQCAYRLSASSLCFNDIVYYTGQDLVGTMRIEGIPDGENKTADLINTNKLNVSWGVDSGVNNSNAQKIVNNAISDGTYEDGKIPWGYEFEVSFINITGNSNYYWLGTSTFETDKAMDETFYYALSWYDEVSDMEKDSLTDRSDVTNQQIFGTRLVVTDVRELITEVEKIKDILNNPDGYTEEQIEKYEKYIEAIPDGMLEGTTFYTQEQVDTVYDYVTGVIEDFADTEEYMYYRDKAFALIEKNSDGTYVNSDIYTTDSLSKFETTFKAVDIGAYLPYPAARQNEVDEATAAVKRFFSELVGVNTEIHSSNGTTTDTVWETTDGIDVPSGDTDNDHTIFKLSNTTYKFVQVSDNQKFTFTQELMGKAKNVNYSILGAVRPNFESFTFDATCDGTNCILDEESGVVNNTSSFIERLDSSSKTTTDNVTSFNGWKYNNRSGDTVHGFNLTKGVLQQTLLTSDTQFMGSTTYHTFYGDATIMFAGNDKETDENGNRVARDSEIDTSFYWKLTSSYNGTYYHAHIPVKILITDVRPLADLYYELHKLTYFSASAEERAKYPAESVEKVKNALATVPDEMFLGTEYYTQDEVNSYYNALLNAKNSLEVADTSRYEEAVKNADEIITEGNSQGRYDEEDWNSFVESVTNAKDTIGDDIVNVPKTEQDNIDSATEIIKNATEEIYNKRYIFINFKGELNEVYKTYRVRFSETLTFKDLADMPELPESDSFKKYIGWYYENNTTMKLTDTITEDVTIFCYEEEIRLVTKTESGAEIDAEKSFFKGLKHGTTVDTLKNSLDNNLDYVVVKDINGNVVDNSVSIATGMTIELVSRENNLVVNEKVTVVVRGEITGDGLVNDDDYEKSRGMCLKTMEYGENEKAFFAANDTDGDGVLDVLDLFNISNMRYGN